MHLAIFSESYEPIINGVSVCVSTLRDGLEQRNEKVTVFAPKYPGYYDSHARVIRVPSVRTAFMPTYPIPLPRLRKLPFNPNEFDIIHSQTPFILGLMALKLGKRHSIPVVSTNHTLYTEYSHYFPLWPKTMAKQILITLMRQYYNQCNVVVVPSKPVGEILRFYGVRSKIEVIKTGVEPIGKNLSSEQRSVVRKKMVGTDSGQVLLYVGRVAKEKNLYMLLRALQETIRAGLDARLVIVGGGSAFNETKLYAKSLDIGGDRIFFTGMMARKDISDYYEAADLFVFPSVTETQGIAICEAMTAGLPVVAVNAGGIPENVCDGVDGYLTQDSSGEFAQRIIELLEDKDKRLIMGNAAEINSARFTVSSMIDQMQNLYTSLIR